MKLEVGMMIYTADGTCRYPIISVTEDYAYAMFASTEVIYNKQFNRDISNEALFECSGAHNRWSRIFYAVETPSLIDAYERSKLTHKIISIDSSLITTEDMKSIVAILEKNHE